MFGLWRRKREKNSCLWRESILLNHHECCCFATVKRTGKAKPQMGKTKTKAAEIWNKNARYDMSEFSFPLLKNLAGCRSSQPESCRRVRITKAENSLIARVYGWGPVAVWLTWSEVQIDEVISFATFGGCSPRAEVVPYKVRRLKSSPA